MLARQPRWLVALVPVLLLLGVILLPPALATVCLVLLLAGLGWLAALAWPVLDGRSRALRVAALLLVLALGVSSLR